MNIKPPPELRDMTEAGQRGFKAILRGIAEVTDGMTKCKFVKSCISCDHFNEQMEVCNKDPQKRRPPARIIAFGCPAWENIDDDIPF